jgi:hypothetical protein
MAVTRRSILPLQSEPQGEVERLPGKKFIFDAKAAAS